MQIGAVVRAAAGCGLAFALAAGLRAPAAAQTDWFNTDAGRPVRIEDAYSTERYAFELKLAPVRLERGRGGLYTWGTEPEIAYGILPRTHIEIGLPILASDGFGGSGEVGIAGLEVSAFRNLHTETRGLPGLALRADALFPVGRFGPDRTYASLTAIATRSWPFGRLHVNAQYTFGRTTDEPERVVPDGSDGVPDAGAGAVETSRWLAGIAIDRPLPLRSLLLTADVHARQPIHEAEDVEWHSGAGFRYQLNPRVALDAGIGRRLNGNPTWSLTFGAAYAFSARSLIPLRATPSAPASPAAPPRVRAYEQVQLPARHNWAFRRAYASADRLFNAFDYGHAILYETLWAKAGAPAELLEGQIYDRVVDDILVRPPRLPLEEAAIEVEYARLAPEAKMMFDWAHILHRQVYDVWADERIAEADKDARVAELLAYYKSRPDLAFSSQPKNMDLMEGQYYSTVFRERYPKFNGLIWAYHWLQVGLYEPLVTARTLDERKTGVLATVTRFWQMLESPPDGMPRLMPMTAAVAPAFAARYPEIAIIFDNLHGMHDVVSDILASPDVPRQRKREEILSAADRYRDATSFVMTTQEWLEMSIGMGAHNMGGPAVGFLPPLPEGTVPRGAVMAGMAHDAHAGHAPPPAASPGQGGDAELVNAVVDVLMRMLGDPATRQRILADRALHDGVAALIARLPEAHRGHLLMMLHGGH